ncbi:hypothetical protein HPB50_015480 [Hyalomma asiaticum]|uniref:Uncharacterized protein n=1 Tax=Hyalomma asiaticum TaxID=266040 RepID=A0ACB7RI99_HYAAI|nr:hypothetical protein HPB50_015480 [Hyalomma asiaticum]
MAPGRRALWESLQALLNAEDPAQKTMQQLQAFWRKERFSPERHLTEVREQQRALGVASCRVFTVVPCGWMAHDLQVYTDNAKVYEEFFAWSLRQDPVLLRVPSTAWQRRDRFVLRPDTEAALNGSPQDHTYLLHDVDLGPPGGRTIHYVNCRKAQSEDQQRCLLDGVDCLIRSAPKVHPRQDHIKSVENYLKARDLRLLVSDKQGGFVVMTSGTFGVKAAQALDKNFIQVKKAALRGGTRQLHTDLLHDVDRPVAGAFTRTELVKQPEHNDLLYAVTDVETMAITREAVRIKLQDSSCW